MCVGLLERVRRGGSGWNVEVRPLPPDQPRSLGLPGLPVMEGCGPWAAGLGGTLGCHPCFLPAVTASDCYVTLWLPTASSHQLQTRTVKNCRNPVWNQSFHFRIHSQIKVDGRQSWPRSLSPPLLPPSLLFPASPPLPAAP